MSKLFARIARLDDDETQGQDEGAQGGEVGGEVVQSSANTTSHKINPRSKHDSSIYQRHPASFPTSRTFNVTL